MSDSWNHNSDSLTGGTGPQSSPSGKEGVRFLVAGGVLYVFNFSIFILLYVTLSPALPYTVPYLLAYLVGLFVSHAVYRKFVFKQYEGYLPSLGKYFLATATSSLVAFFSFTLFHVVAPNYEIVLQLTLTVFLVVFQYLLSNLWIFRKRRPVGK